MSDARLDLRGLPVGERSAKILEVFDGLPLSESITVITDSEPRGLFTGIEQSRRNEMLLWFRRVGESEWHVQMKRSIFDPVPVPASILKRTLAFGHLSDEQLAELAAVSTMHTVRRGQTIVLENTDWPYVGVAFDGVFALASGNGTTRQRIYYEIFPYEIFGETEFFDRAQTAGRLIVLSRAGRYLRIPRDAMARLAMENPQTFAALGHVTAQRARELMQALLRHTMPIVARVAFVLLPYALPDAALAEAQPPLPNMTQSQIAAAAGTVKEVAARAIAELEARGMLKREHGHIRYLDRQKLIDLIREES